MANPSPDTTAHPSGLGNLLATKTEGVSGVWQTLSNPTPFSTGPGPILLVAKFWLAGGGIPMPLQSLVNTSGLTWTKRVNFDSSGTGAFAEIWTAFSLAGSLTSQTVTATVRTSSSTQEGFLDIEVWKDVALTEAACLGGTDGFVDDAGTSKTINATVSVQAIGSALTGVFGADNAGATLTADANTTFSATWSGPVGGDWAASGHRTSNTSATGNTTFGSSTADLFGAVAALEIKGASSGAAPLSGAIAGGSAISGNLTTRVALSAAIAGGTSLHPQLAGQVALSGRIAGGSALQPSLGPAVFPQSLVIPVSATQTFAASPVPTWAVREGATGGTISAGSGGAATYTAPASPGTFHVTASAGAGVTVVIVTVVAAPTNPTVRIDSPFQVMDGFGCMESDSEPAPITDQIADLLYDQTAGIGFSIHRMGIQSDLSGPRHDPGDFATTPWDLWWHVHKAMARNANLRVVAAPWTPPSAIKDNGSNLGGHLNTASYATWAASIASFVPLAASQTPPVPIYAISPQNEPDFSAPYDSCLYSDTQMRDFIKSLGAALSTLSSGRPLLMAPEPSDPTLLETYLGTLEADPTALGYTSIYATHQYGHATMPAATRAARPVWVSEMSGLTGGPEAVFDPTITDGIAIAKWVHSAITSGNVTAWLWLWGFVAYNGTPPTTEFDGQNQTLVLTNGDLSSPVITQFTVTKRLYTIGHFSKFVRPGHQRNNIIGTLPTNVSATAYRDPVSGRNVVVCINDSGSSASLALDFAGGTAPKAVVPFVTSGTALGLIGTAGNLEPQATIALSGSTLTATLAANSVTTFVEAAPMSASIAGGSTLSGQLQLKVALAGAVAGGSALQGTLRNAVALQGSIAGGSALRGALTELVALSGQIAGQSVLQGVLASTSGGAVALSGAIAGGSILSASLSIAAALSSSIAGGSAVSPQLTSQVALTGKLAGGSALSGTLALQVALQGAVAGGSAIGSPPLSLAAALAAQIAGGTVLQGALANGLQVALSGRIAGGAALSGSLALAVRMQGVIAGATALRAALGVGAKLARGKLLLGQPARPSTLNGQAGAKTTLLGQGDN